MKHDSVLLIGFGGPEQPTEVRPFIAEVLKGRPVPPERIEEVVKNYERIGGSSPYNKHTFEQARALSSALKEHAIELPVYVGMRIWKPLLAETLKRMSDEGRRRAVGIVLAPHRSEPSWERYLKAVEDARKEIKGTTGKDAPAVDYVDAWFDHPLFIEAISEHIHAALEKIPAERRRRAWLIFTAHSIPLALASLYTEQLTETAHAVVNHLDFSGEWSLAYQSRSGNPREAWLEPDVREVIRERAARGEKDVVVAPIGFICDHTEVLFDLDVDAQTVARESGINMVRAGTVGAHESFIRMFVELIQRAEAAD